MGYARVMTMRAKSRVNKGLETVGVAGGSECEKRKTLASVWET